VRNAGRPSGARSCPLLCLFLLNASEYGVRRRVACGAIVVPTRSRCRLEKLAKAVPQGGPPDRGAGSRTTAVLLPRLGKDLAAAHEGLRFNVEAVAHGTLPRFELKAKRLKDEREYK